MNLINTISGMKKLSTRERNRVLSIFEGCSARIIFNLTSGAFIVGFLKYMGASDSLCGKIAAIPVLTAMIQFVSPIVIEKLSWKLKLITLGCFLHRFLLFTMLFIPMLPISVTGKLTIAAVIYFISYLMVGFINPAVANLIVSFVPQNIRGKFFGMREAYILTFSTIVTLIMGKILDIYEAKGAEYYGYIFIFIVVLIHTVINAMSFAMTKEIRIKPNPNSISIKDVFLVPLKDKGFRKIILLFLLWNVGLQFGAPFFGVYQVSNLKLSYTFITANSIISAVCYMISAVQFGKLADKKSWMHTTLLSIGLLAVAHFSWLFVYSGTVLMYVLIPILSIAGGFAWGGINISMFNIQFDYTPSEGRTLYLGFNAAFNGIVGYMAAFLSSELVDKFSDLHLQLGPVPIGITQIVLSTSGILIGLCTLYIFVFLRKKN